MEYKKNISKQSIKNEDGVFYGYASTFNVVDSYNDIILNGAFKNILINKKNEIKLCWQHNPSKVIGKFNVIKEDSVGLYVEGEINVKENEKIYSLVKNELINGLSIGYMVDDYSFDTKGRRVLKSIDLKEISIVSFPANKHSNILYCKSINNTNNIAKLNNNINKLINIFKY